MTAVRFELAHPLVAFSVKPPRAMARSERPPKMRTTALSANWSRRAITVSLRLWSTVPVALSKTQVDRLGKRLRESARLDDGDLQLLQDLRSDHADALEEVGRRLAEGAGLEPTTRLKTVDTIIEKLRRLPGLRLSQMQDVAGARVTRPLTLPAQDLLVATISSRFDDPRVVDRRENSSSGYRAVHLIVSIGGLSVEIQVRTTLQDLWAQVAERSGDLVGRAIRYGESPRREDIPAGIDVDALVRSLATFVAPDCNPRGGTRHPGVVRTAVIQFREARDRRTTSTA